jgi:signal transduction histidine kinase
MDALPRRAQCRKSYARVPEVISKRLDLEGPTRIRLWSRMRLARVLSGLAPNPVFLAGYLAWAAVAIGLWRVPPVWTPLGETAGRTVAALCMLAFVGGIMRRGRDGGSIISLSLMVVSALVLLALGPSSFTPILLIVIAAAIAAVYRPGIAVIALVALNLAFLAILVARWRIADPGFMLLVYGSVEVFALLTTLERARAERVSRELREVNAQLLATRELLAESARDGERLRVSRELHDVAGHGLTALALNLDLLGQEVPVSKRREWLVSRDLVSKLLSELRSVVANLRRHDGMDVREALRRIAEAFPAPQIHMNLDERVRVDGAEQATAIVRAGQEGLTNAVRHANARNIWLSLSREEETLRLEVRDDGTSRGSYVMGHGLRGVQERMELLGGRVETDIAPEGGFRLRVFLPTGRES